MYKQRETFDGIDTYSITNYGNFSFFSKLLEESESRYIHKRPDINTLLDLLYNNNSISHKIANSTRARAEDFAEVLPFLLYHLVQHMYP